jgi:hypothetical protein
MLALQTMQVRDIPDTPLSNITNGQTPRPSPATTFEPISSQILSLTTICTNLQREMSQLSRRSKDNASDLIGLKEATNSRDEDIRKSLKELVATITAQQASGKGLLGGNAGPRNGSSFTTPPNQKTVQLPRIPSPSMFDTLPERLGSPSLLSLDGAPSLAMLEKIIREMVTKEGQDRLLTTLNALFDKASKESGETAKKVTELVHFIKDGQSQALITRGGDDGDPPNGLEYGASGSASQSGPLMKTTRDLQPTRSPTSAGTEESKPYSSPKAADFVGDEMIKLLKKIKDSVFQTGGFVGEVKAQQRDLRGEVMGMGRELARKIDEFHQPATGAKAIEDGSGKQDIARLVQEGLAELKDHLDNVMREKRRQSTSTVLSRSSVDSREVRDVVKYGLANMNAQTANAGLDKEAILEAVKEAYEAYRPDIEVSQFGLERDEILQCLKEGLEDYRNNAPTQSGITREELDDAIQKAMQNFQPPPPVNDSHETREEVLMAVRECLDEYKPSLALTRSTSVARNDHGHEVTREVVLDAVMAGLANYGPNAPRELEISRDDLCEAVKAGLEASGTPFGQYGEQVVKQLHELVQDMKSQFKDYSQASGRDTEQVLDAMKDGLEDLRVEIEQYVDRAQDVTSKDEIIDTVRDGLEHLRSETERYCAAGPQGDAAISRAEMLDYMKTEFEHLHETIRELNATSSPEKDDILGAMHDGFESLKASIANRGFDSDEVDEAMKAEFESLKDTLDGMSSSHRDEIIEIVQNGFDSLHGKLDGGALNNGSGDEIIRAIKEELEPIRESLASAMVLAGGGGNSDIIDTVREHMDGMRTHLVSEQDTKAKETLGAIQGEFEHLRNTLGSSLVAPGGADSKDEILEALQNATDSIRAFFSSEHGESTKVVAGEIEQLRNSLTTSIVQAGSNDSKEEMMENLRNVADAVRAVSAQGGISEGLLEAMRGEFEVLRSNVSRSASKADSEEILEAVRLGLDDLRSHLEKKIENPEPQMKATGEIVDALNEGLESLKTDVQKMVDKPIDMTVSYEILDTLKQGLEELRNDMSRLKGSTFDDDDNNERSLLTGNEIVLAEDPENSQAREIASQTPEAPDALRRHDLEKLEVMLAQLQIKVDTVDANVQNPVFQPQAAPAEPAEGATVKADLSELEEMLKDMQATLTIMAARELDNEVVAKKEDTDAIETLLRNTKAQLDEIQLPSENAVTKEHIEVVESLSRSTREAIDDLSARVDESNASSKADIAVVEVLVQDLKTALDQMQQDAVKAKDIDEGEDGPVSKKDLDILGVISMEVRDKLNELQFPETDSMPSKADIEQLTGLIHDFRDSHDKLKDSYETDIGITAKAFDDRKQEAEDIITAIGIMRSGLGDIRDELKAKLDVSFEDVSGLRDNVKTLEDTIGQNFNITADVKELMEIMNREFDRVHGTFDDMKATQEQKATETGEKYDEAKAAVVADICAKLDEKFDVIMSKYDDAQRAAEDQVKAMEEKSAEHSAIMSTTKEVADDLRISLDTLGTTVTAMETTFTEISDKISGDTQTVFARIDEGFNKIGDLHSTADAKQEHQLTRDEVVKAVSTIEALQGDVTEFHPQFMVTLQEVLALVNTHYEHSQKAQSAAEEQAKAATEQTRSLTDELKTSLPALLPPPPPAIEPPPSYDDSEVKGKLDVLMEHVTATEHATSQLDRLDKIHAQVMATAAEVSEFVTTQTRLITEGHESKEKEAEEMALLLERRIAEKEHIENDIQGLSSEKESLMAVVEMLRSEREALASQKSRLAADVSSLETALQIRKDELHAMDVRADALERRILEGIMDHSRALLLTKGATGSVNPTPAKTSRLSNVSHSTIGQLPTSNAATQGINLALKQRPSPARRNAALQPNKTDPASRRILSLNQISHNTPTGAQGYLAAKNSSLSNPQSSSFLKRSQSVRTQGRRKVSWNGSAKPDRRSISGRITEENKENDELDHSLHDLSEEEHEHDHHDYEHEDDYGSDAGTERRHSIMTGDTYDDDHGGSEYTATGSYITGSYMTGSDVDGDRRTSYNSTIRSTLGVDSALEHEHEQGEAGTQESDQTMVLAGDNHHAGRPQLEWHNDKDKKELVVWGAAPSDSGLGSDLPTAAMSGSETDYFRRAAEEEASSVGP